MANEDDDLLTSAARAIGSALGKVSSTLHLAESKPAAPAPRKSAAKSAKKKPARKTVTKKSLAPAKKSAKRTKS